MRSVQIGFLLLQGLPGRGLCRPQGDVQDHHRQGLEAASITDASSWKAKIKRTFPKAFS